jgi:hypothetical protein
MWGIIGGVIIGVWGEEERGEKGGTLCRLSRSGLGGLDGPSPSRLFTKPPPYT